MDGGGKAINRGTAIELALFAVAFIAVFASYSDRYFLPICPGYFLLQTFALVLVAHWLLSGCRKASLALPPRFFFYLLLLLAWACLTTTWCGDGWIVAEGLCRLITFVLLTLGVSHVLHLRPYLRDQFWNIVMTALCALAIVYFTRVQQVGRQESYHFLFGNPNLAGAALGFACAFSLTRAFFYVRQWPYFSFNFALGLVCGIAAVSSGSKGAMFAMAITCSISLWLVLSRRFLWLKALLYGVLGVEALTVAAIYVHEEAAVKIWLAGAVFWTKLTAAMWPSVQIRLFVWEGTLKMICASPFRFVCGWGPGNFFPNFPDFQDVRIYTAISQAPVVEFPHNFCLEMFAEYGAIGLFLFLLLVGKALGMAVRLWGIEDQQKSNAYGAFAGIFMLFLDSQVSVALSYPHAQMLLALSISWLLAHRQWGIVLWGKTAVVRRWCFCILAACAIMSGLFLWKLCCWDSLWFHYHYKRASRIYKETLSLHWGSPDLSHSLATVRAISLLVDIRPPLCENYYTCCWRNRVGQLLAESPYSLPQAESLFLKLESQMPKFGYFLLVRAGWAARQQKYDEARHYFWRFARHNPFSSDLWLCWREACRKNEANPYDMLQANLELKREYGEEGVLLLGEALALDALNQKTEAQEVMLRAYHWSSGRHKGDQRADEVRDLAKRYLGL